MKDTFDYIIVGGGSAGCILANRLTENPSIEVCLLEAGPADRSPLITMPAGILFLMRSRRLNWNYATVCQPHCDNRALYWPSGKTLGGSSAINAMIYIRGDHEIYNEWAKLGNNGWSYNDLLPYFQRVENSIAISEPRYMNPLVNVFVTAAQQAGYNYTPDLNAYQGGECVGYYQLSQIDGQRCSNARAYLQPIKSRVANLKVMTHSLATKIILKGKRAVGIEYYSRRKGKRIYARKEVLISAGAIGSPKILLLSGIGGQDELQKLNIPVIHDLPGVGKNLQDHLDIHVCHLEKTDLAIRLQFFHPKILWRYVAALLEYLFARKGELTTNYAQGAGFIKSDPGQLKPNIQWHFLPVMETKHAKNLWPAIKHYGYTLKNTLLYPKSRGQICLVSADPFQSPKIDPNYFSDSQDLDTLVAAVKRSQEVLNQMAFEAHKLQDFQPTENVQTDNELRAYVIANSETLYHPVGTCKMGHDVMAVVDDKLRVHGVQGLRVIDASIMPVITAGNTNTPVSVIAEKAADLIKQA